MDAFLKKIKENANGINHDDAYNEIIVKLMDKKLTDDAKTDGFLNAYDSEKGFNGKPCLGNVYIFNYEAKEPSKYSYKGQEIYYYNPMPIVFLTSITTTTLRGINLNFCNKGLKTIILNLFLNLDEDFYDGGDAELYDKGELVFSKEIYKKLIDPSSEQLIKAFLKNYSKEVDYNLLFRNYSISNIKDFRLIEPWQLEYLPFLTYYGSLKKDTLEAILKISGISKILI